MAQAQDGERWARAPAQAWPSLPFCRTKPSGLQAEVDMFLMTTGRLLHGSVDSTGTPKFKSWLHFHFRLPATCTFLLVAALVAQAGSLTTAWETPVQPQALALASPSPGCSRHLGCGSEGWQALCLLNLWKFKKFCRTGNMPLKAIAEQSPPS